MQSAYIAIPCYDGRIHVGTFMSTLQAVMDLASVGVHCNLETYVGDSLLASTRNVLIGKFLRNTQCTDLICIDSDISYEAGTLQRLLSHPVEFVAGLYRFKNDDEAYPMQCVADPDGKGLWSYDPVTGAVSEDGLIEVAGVPFGFVRMTRGAVQKMFDAYAAREYEPKDVPGLKTCCLFDIPFEGGQMVGEDYSFCHKWTGIGGKIWVDPHIRLDHCGQKVFKGNLGAWLRGDRKSEAPSIMGRAIDPEKIEALRKLAAENKWAEQFERVLGAA